MAMADLTCNGTRSHLNHIASRASRRPSRPSKTAFSTAGTLVCGASPPSTPLKNLHGNLPVSAARQSSSQGAAFAQDLATKKTTASPPQPVNIEINSLGGNTIVKSVFASSDSIMTVKEAVHMANGWPVWQQRLTFQGSLLQDTSTLGELSLPMQGATLEIVMRQGPSDEVVAAAKEVLQQGEAALSTLRRADLHEVRALIRPPEQCMRVCLAVMHLLAGTLDGIDVKKDGSPKNPTWDECGKMLRRKDLVPQLRQIPSAIEEGKLKEERIMACRRQIVDLEPDHVRMVSLACHGLIEYILSISRYYDNVSQITEEAGGGVTLSELTSEPVAR
mmetsp:Transcript_109210/g.216865  ORF Transcript_109210/g.216865 Transcript_109210/m.216865 type:complete len:333 (-) Transcript_109210:77-1075(-)